MPSIPAFCDSCGTAFPSGFFFENASNVTLSGNRSGPCPRCGGMGHIPDGVFNFIGNTIEILSAPQRTVEELTRLVQIIHEAKAKQQSNEQVAAQIKRELPGLSLLADILPKNRGELYGFLAVVIATTQLLLESPQPTQEITINVSQVVEQTLENASSTKKISQESLRSKKIGRNELCPCGSGKKYKKCCGSLK
jgi:hypothetical protein